MIEVLEIKYFVNPTSEPQILAVKCIKFTFIEVIFEYIRKINADINSFINEKLCPHFFL